jgi:DNA (cytosine-5)-methyltransferase 1
MRRARAQSGAPTIISLYTGAGGLDYGLEAAGFETRVAVDVDKECCETLRKNQRWEVIQRSIFTIRTAEILEAGRLQPSAVDLVVGGPPCQPFSKSGFWVHGESGRLDDPRADTLSAFMRVIEEARPRAILFENVEGLAYARKDEGLQLLLRRLDVINRRTKSCYRPVFNVLNAADYGVPQLRRRFFLVAARDGTEFVFPRPTHGARDVAPSLWKDSSLPSYRTAWDALGDVSPDADEDLHVRGKWGDLLPSIPEGQNYLWHTDRGGGMRLFGWRRRYWSFLLKLAKDRPSWTIQAQPGPAIGPFHWESRRLTTRELCRLQTFPDDVSIVGERSAVQKQVGNAVPSLLAEILGREIRTQLLKLDARSEAPTLLPPDRSPVPPPERPRAVPRRYWQLAGNHPPHPGTGRGNAALRRRHGRRP